ncbi:MAG: type VI secretion system ATPase TssH [Polyangia bacterium]
MLFLVNYQALLDHLNRVCFRALEQGASLAISLSHAEVDIDHFLLKLIDDVSSDVANILRGLGVPTTPVVRALQERLQRKRRSSERPEVSPYIATWIQDAWLLGSLEHKATQVRSGFLLAVLLRNPERYQFDRSSLADSLRALDGNTVQARLFELTRQSSESSVKVAASVSAAGAPPAAAASATESALSRFTEDLTAMARAGKVEPVVGRAHEIQQLINILCRHRKNNPIIVGEAGVGKTALVEGLACQIVEGKVSGNLAGVEVRSLDLGRLQAGAGVRGEFEARLTAVLSEIKGADKPIILFIDEAHMLIGAGNPQGGGDAANLLKPALARGTLRTIAATTWSEYKKYFEKDAALSRRFQAVKVGEPDRKTAIDMMRRLKEHYVSTYGVRITDAAVEAAVDLSTKYISGRLLPDKAVDLLDTCVAKVRQAMDAVPPELLGLQNQIESLKRERRAKEDDLAQTGHGTAASPALSDLGVRLEELEKRYHDHEKRWRAERVAAEAVLKRRPPPLAVDGPVTSKEDPELQKAQAALASLRQERPMVPIEVDPPLVASVVSEWTGIPAGSMMRNELELITNLQTHLEKRIRGQSHALASIAGRMRTARTQMHDPREALGVFLLVGPSGTGKTETALAVSDLLFGGEQFVITINMTEYQEKHTISRLIGSPPGYVGFGEGGVLTEAIRQRPYSVVLLDEVEKASTDVLNLFYQAFDKGMLSDGEGRLIDCRNTVFFLTSNLGSSQIMRWASRSEEALTLEGMTAALWPILANHFKPALLARMTVVPYFPLAESVMAEIVTMKLAQLSERLWERYRVRLTFSDEVKSTITEDSLNNAETGARTVSHAVRTQLMPALTSRILTHLSAGDMPDSLQVTLAADGSLCIRQEAATRASVSSQKGEL